MNSAQHALSEGAVITPRPDSEISLIFDYLRVEILYQLWLLGEEGSHPGALQEEVQISLGRKFHKQNFRRVVEGLAAQDYLTVHPCHLLTGGRPAKSRYMITDAGKNLLKDVHTAALSLADRLKEIA